MAQAVRRRLRAQIRRSRLIEEDLANPGFSLDDLNFLHSAGPAETDGVAVNGAGESASNAARSVVAAAPTAPDVGLYETSLEPTVQHDTSDVQATAQPSEFHEPFDPETTAFDPTSRDSRASFSSSHSPFEYDDLVSDPAWTVENPASLNPPEEKVVECGRSVYDPVRQWFSLETLKTQGVTSSAETCERKVDSGWIESARAKEESFVAVAPTLPPRVSHAENGKLVIKVTPPTPPVTMRPQYRQRHRSMNDGMIDADSSHLTLPRLRPSARGSAESDARDSGAEGVESADETEAKSSFPAAPTPPTANLGIEPCNMGILVTPPSPLTAIKPSLSHNCAKSLGMSPDDSRVLSHHPEPGSSPCQSYNAGLDFQEPVVLAKPVPVKNYSRPFRPETDQPVGSAGYVRLSKRTDSEMFMRLIEGEAEAQNAHVKNEMLSTPSPFGRSDEIAEQLSFFDMLALGGSIDDADQTVDGVGDSSATDEAKPSFSVEPLSAFSSRKSATATRATKEPTPRPVLHHVRAFASRVTSSLRKWGKVLSKSFAHRPAQPDENLRSSPSFDRLEGLAPSRVPSPDCIGLEDALELPKPDV
ncbi:hypothetical protein FS837_012631 [Tulasnella sp. UAMH 9824]|nr:hypothetical protein FS837_012631 [Tulasnella sp. UAMH 9824]